MDWSDLLAVQGTLKSLLQHQSSKVSMLQCSAIFIFQLSHPYMTTGKTIALTGYRGKSSNLSYCVATAFFRSLLPHLRIFLPSESISFQEVRNVHPQTALHLESRHVTWAPPLSRLHANILRREQGYRGMHHVELSMAGMGGAWQRDARLAAATGPTTRTHLVVCAEGPMLCGSHARVSARATRGVICIVFLATWPPSLTDPLRNSMSSSISFYKLSFCIN